VIAVSREQFEALVAAALDSIPAELARHIDNVAVFVEDRSRYPGLLGLYEGIPLTGRGTSYAGAMPDRITLYREAICARSDTEDELVEEIRRTVVHEIAHHFGISDARLRALGY